MSRRFPVVFVLAGFLALPLFANAQELGNLTSFVDQLGDLVDELLPVVFTLALLFFFWGVVRFLFGLIQGKSPSEAGGAVLFWGVVALFVLASIWGIVGFLQDIFGVEGGGEIDVPEIDSQFNRE